MKAWGLTATENSVMAASRNPDEARRFDVGFYCLKEHFHVISVFSHVTGSERVDVRRPASAAETRLGTQKRCGMPLPVPAFETTAKSYTPTAECIPTYHSFISAACSASLVLVQYTASLAASPILNRACFFSGNSSATTVFSSIPLSLALSYNDTLYYLCSRTPHYILTPVAHALPHAELSTRSTTVRATFDTTYDNRAGSLNGIACSNGANGLVARLPTSPTFPFIGGAPNYQVAFRTISQVTRKVGNIRHAGSEYFYALKPADTYFKAKMRRSFGVHRVSRIIPLTQSPSRSAPPLTA